MAEQSITTPTRTAARSRSAGQIASTKQRPHTRAYLERRAPPPLPTDKPLRTDWPACRPADLMHPGYPAGRPIDRATRVGESTGTGVWVPPHRHGTTRFQGMCTATPMPHRFKATIRLLVHLDDRPRPPFFFHPRPRPPLPFPRPLYLPLPLPLPFPFPFSQPPPPPPPPPPPARWRLDDGAASSSPPSSKVTVRPPSDSRARLCEEISILSAAFSAASAFTFLSFLFAAFRCVRKIDSICWT